MLEHLNSSEGPSGAQIPVVNFTIAPAVTAIIVQNILIVDPKLAPIIGFEAKAIPPSAKDPYAGRPTHCEMITSTKSRPSSG
jgi:hypothetical protein